MSELSAAFSLHPTLAADTVWLGDLPLSRVLLARESRYPWIILVPRRAGIREWYELEDEAGVLLSESCSIARMMQVSLMPDKLNIATIGNVVDQLHLHHVARFHEDAAWPKPIWGLLPPKHHTEESLQAAVTRWQQWLAVLPEFTKAS
ncbi:MAG: HIT domain-containing protein [Aeromonadaceae bacterium]